MERFPPHKLVLVDFNLGVRPDQAAHKLVLSPWSHVCVHILRYKKRSGELGEMTGDVALRTATTNLEDGFRLTVWAYDRQEVCLTLTFSKSR